MATERLNIGLTVEAMEKLEELRNACAKQIKRRGLTLSQTAAWAVHYLLSLENEKAKIKALLAGMAHEETGEKSGNPGPNHNGSGRPVLIGAGGAERILPPRPVPGSVKRRGGKLAQSDQAITAPQL
jgi:hypothetical protein